ncbi:MAG: AAA family ATPase [Thermoleophilia bacterium]|nr:AAA family ATPase [Thermoleophilia bacterium]
MLVGRQSEVAAIVELLERAAGGASGVIAVRGGPGLGKTALLDEADRRAERFRVLRAAGFESEARLPYATLHQLLQPLLARVDDLPAPQADALRAAFGLAARAEPDRLLVGLAVLTLLADAAEERPLLVLVDDVHWVDPESADALTFAVRRLQAERVGVVLAARDSDAGATRLPGACELRLTPLARAEAEQLVAARHGEGLRARRGEIVEAAAGNPLALVELADAAARGADGTTTVEQAYLEAIERLPELTRTFLLVAAADQSVELGRVVAAAESLGAGLAALEPAELAGLVRVEADTVAFRHPLVRSVAYRSATFARRRAAHAALAAVLSGEHELDRRAWHRAAATIGPDEAVARLLETSAGRATARSGYAAAAAALERAAQLSADRAGRTRRLVQAADAAHMAGGQEHIRVLLEQIEEPIEDPVVALAAARVRGMLAAREGRLDESMRIFLDAASDALDVDRRLTLDLVALAQEAAGLAGNHDAILEFESWADRFGAPETTEEEIVLGLVRGFTAIAGGDRAGAAPLLARSAHAGRAADDPRILRWAATSAMFLGEEGLVFELMRRAVDAARTRGAFGGLAFLLHLLAGVERRLGDFAGAEADAEESHRLAVETGQRVVAAGALSTLTALAAFRGDRERAQKLAAETRALAQPRGLPVALGGVARALAELELVQGRAAEALAILESSVGGPDDRRRNHPYALFSAPLLVEAAARAGKVEAARRSLETLADWSRSGGLSWAEPLVARGGALVAEDEAEAERRFQQALELHGRDGSPFETARTRLLYGEFLRRARRKTEARDELRQALEAFESLGARLWAERALAELRATGATARKRDDSTRSDLTPQELQIVRLVALGRTNPEVGAQLFLSPKTVQYHLRKVFAKLGVSSRTELTRLVAEGRVAGAAVAAEVADDY